MRSFCIITLLSFLLQGYSYGQTYTAQQRLISVNAAWQNLELSKDEEVLVGQCHSNSDVIQLHLRLVTVHLTQRTAYLQIDDDAKSNRLKALAHLTDYYERKVFPINNKQHETVPVFLDDIGTHCAVGFLLHVTGHDDIVTTIAAENNLGYIAELNLQYEALGLWSDVNGFSVEELAWIQPGYQYFCNPSISVGEVVHNTCSGKCEGGFLVDVSELPLQLGDIILLVGTTYKMSNGNWQEIPGPDCLCAGLYKQEFEIYSTENDSTYQLFQEIEITSPEPVRPDIEDQTGHAGLCQAYVIPEADGGTAPYTFEIIDDEDTAYGLGPLCDGIYSIIAEDANGCVGEERVYVTGASDACDAMVISDMQLDPNTPGKVYLRMSLGIDSVVDADRNIFADLYDEGSGSFIGSGFLNFYGHQPAKDSIYTLLTVLDSIPLDFRATLWLEFDYVWCYLPYAAVISSTYQPREPDINIYPNPFRTEATIEIDPGFEPIALIVYTTHGQVVRNEKWSDGLHYNFTRDDLPAGQYMIMILGKESMEVGRIVIAE